jgi:hypothetical protein
MLTQTLAGHLVYSVSRMESKNETNGNKAEVLSLVNWGS